MNAFLHALFLLEFSAGLGIPTFESVMDGTRVRSTAANLGLLSLDGYRA